MCYEIDIEFIHIRVMFLLVEKIYFWNDTSLPSVACAILYITNGWAILIKFGMWITSLDYVYFTITKDPIVVTVKRR